MEADILAQAEALAKAPEHQDSALLSEYIKLTKEYKKVARNLKLLVKVGDKQQAQLTSVSEKLSKYLSPQVYQSIFEGKNIGKLGTTRKPLTVFFSDLQGFTQLTDKLEPEAIKPE